VQLVDPTATVGKDCKLGPNVVIGPGCRVGSGVRLQRCVLMKGAVVKDNAWIKDAIVGWHSSVGRWVCIPFFHPIFSTYSELFIF
jgi:mannose-1-phosphate guanylyltransferase